jgi:tRNA (uracil-5-)-methyltransferase
MHCNYFGVCGSCKTYELDYEEQIEKKKELTKELFSSLYPKSTSSLPLTAHAENFDVFTSPSSNYRSRAEFRIWHEGDDLHYAMNKLEGKGVVLIDNCPKVTKDIEALMPELRELIKKDSVLRDKLFSVEFLSSSTKVLVSLLYHKKIDESWDESARVLEEKLNISVIGRSRKVKRVLSDDFVIDTLHVANKSYMFKIIEGGFSQPNSFVNVKMIEWVLSHIEETKDLLELYCGHGNFSIPLSGKFRKVLATEISKPSIKSAKDSCVMNNVENIEFLRMSVEDLTSALNKEREFNRLKDFDLDSYDFSHVFVDPPRSGIDEKSLEFISQFDTIIYISCNPMTLKRDSEFLKDTFMIKDFAIFDQFPHTEHLESGVILKKI